MRAYFAESPGLPELLLRWHRPHACLHNPALHAAWGGEPACAEHNLKLHRHIVLTACKRAWRNMHQSTASLQS